MTDDKKPTPFESHSLASVKEIIGTDSREAYIDYLIERDTTTCVTCGHHIDIHETEDDNAYCLAKGCHCRHFRN